MVVVCCRLHSYFPFSHVCQTRVYQEPCQLRVKNNYFGQLAKWPNTFEVWLAMRHVWLAMRNYMMHFSLELATILITMS